MGNTENVVSEIIKISETKPNVLNSKGILISTFSSVVSPKEIGDFLKLNNRNYLLFDLNEENSNFWIGKEEIHEGLFGFLKEFNEDILKQKTEDLLSTIDLEMTSTTVNSKTKAKKEPKISIDDINNMSPKEKNDLINKLIDKGINNLSAYDKKILTKLSD
jgi:hypothetical protein